jgi:hypothetical protein
MTAARPVYEKAAVERALSRFDRIAELGQASGPIIGLVITLVILKITWDSWRTVRAATIDLDYVEAD